MSGLRPVEKKTDLRMGESAAPARESMEAYSAERLEHIQRRGNAPEVCGVEEILFGNEAEKEEKV